MKERKKLYKAGKLWVTTTLVAFAGIVVTTTSASADDNTVVATPQTSQVNSSEPAPPTSTATPADEASATLLSRTARQLAMLLRILRVGKPLPAR